MTIEYNPINQSSSLRNTNSLIKKEPGTLAPNNDLATLTSDVTAPFAHRSASFIATQPSLIETDNDLQRLINDLDIKDSELFLGNIKRLLEKITISDLLQNQMALDKLFKRYTTLGKHPLHPIYSEWKSIHEDPIAAFSGLEKSLKEGKAKFKYYDREKASRPLHFYRDIPPDTLIKASWGGGLRFIKRFLSGDQKGYPLEKGGVGIQVSPNLTERDEWYANRAVRNNFDSPAILRFEVEAQYLEEANVGYEAALTPEHLDKIFNIELTNLLTKETVKAKNLAKLLTML